ncbi:MAG: Calx-beta domain-containing protein [Gammaproteobacteria bacterium]
MALLRALLPPAVLFLAGLLLAACGGAGTQVASNGDSTGDASGTPGMLSLSADSDTVSQSAGSVTLKVTRSGGSSGTASVSYATTDGTAVAGSNYTAANGTLTWNDGDADDKTIAVAVSATAFSGAKSFTINLSSVGGAGLGSPATATITINGNGTAGGSSPGTLALSAASETVPQTAGSVTLTVTRSGGSSGNASVSYATANGTALAGSNYTAKNGILTWNDGDAAAKTVVISLSAAAFSGTKNFAVDLSSADGAALGSPASANVTINGSGTSGGSAPGTMALSAASDTVAQAAGSVMLTVTRSGGSSGIASASYATANGSAIAGSNYTAKSGTLTWANGDAASKTFAVSLSATAFTGAKNFTVKLSNAAGAGLGTPASATVTINGSGSAGSGTGPAAVLAAKLGFPARLLVGLGGQASTSDPIGTMQSQALTVDIYDEYLGTGDWTSWNAPPCDYVCMLAAKADSIGAVPMFTQYQMANSGDGNIAVISDNAFMTTYWARVKILYQDLAAYDKPALVNLEPDFWGYAYQHSPGGDPTRLAALVTINPDCATLPNNVTGIAGCLISMARKYAPKAYVGFPPSAWGNSDAVVIAFMNAVGAQNADFIVEQTSDRDSGCFEAASSADGCARGGSGWYWDETNQSTPNFQQHLASAQAWHTGIGNLPLIWWQTPLGVPSVTAGGMDYHFRDNREHYFLTHPAELAAVGALGVVFGTGEVHQSSISTDGGQYKSLSTTYFAAPAPLP